MPGIPIPSSTYTFPKGEPIPLRLAHLVFVVFFIGLAVRWVWVHGNLGWNGVLLLVATAVVCGFIDYGLLRFYERTGRAVRVERHVRSADPWQEYRKRRNLALFAFLGYTPVVFVIAMVTIRLFHTTIPAFVAAFSWMAFYAFTGVRFQTFRCPRCHKWFFIRWWPPPSPLARRCVHCGLPKYADV
jgi:hypothetical protein